MENDAASSTIRGIYALGIHREGRDVWYLWFESEL